MCTPPTAELDNPFCEDDPDFISKDNPDRDCAWFALKPEKRCLTDKNASVFCPATCNPRCIGCFDDPDYLNLDKPKRTCEWVAKKPDDRCPLRGDFYSVNEPACFCPSSCNDICVSKCSDNKKYLQQGKELRDCEWVAKKPAKRCDLYDFEAWFGCPKTCNPACATEAEEE